MDKEHIVIEYTCIRSRTDNSIQDKVLIGIQIQCTRERFTISNQIQIYQTDTGYEICFVGLCHDFLKMDANDSNH